MTDYKELFYQSQAEIAKTIEQLDKIKSDLIKCMQTCEEKVTSDDECNEISENN